jgi:hypothetical protein
MYNNYSFFISLSKKIEMCLSNLRVVSDHKALQVIITRCYLLQASSTFGLTTR